MNPTKSPFKFLDAYQKSDHKVFFGRKAETQNLYEAMSGVKHLLVYGPSGSGKTSLVECGLRNQFSDADWFAVTIRRGTNINAAVFTAINDKLTQKIALHETTGMPLEADNDSFGPAVERLFAERFQPVYLLFDQFEELLISGSIEEKQQFFAQLNHLVHYKLPCRILLIMREEFIGHLSEFEHLCPSLFQHRFRVEKMGRSHVETVIQSILDSAYYRAYFSVEKSEELTQKILAQLPDQRKEIELAYLQVFLAELWDRAVTGAEKGAKPVLSANLVREDDNLDSVLESFLEKQLEDLSESFGKEMPLELLVAMITERNTKLQLSEAAIAQELVQRNVECPAPMAALLKALKDRLIVRPSKVGEEVKYEISHDVLALVVGQMRTQKMKDRERAASIYRFYADRPGLLTMDDIGHIRSQEHILPCPEVIQANIEKSLAHIKEQQDLEVVRLKEKQEQELAHLKEQQAFQLALKEKEAATQLAIEAQKRESEAQQQQLKLRHARQRTKVVAGALGLALLILAGAVFFAGKFYTEKKKTGDALDRYETARSQKEQVEFNALLSRATVIVETNGCPADIINQMDSLLLQHKFVNSNDSIAWRRAVNRIKSQNPDCK
jgi:hypothetical protein